ncbi:MAG TPA: VWA domain-containing protein, partial [Pyrinomonadaceae bacterium]
MNAFKIAATLSLIVSIAVAQSGVVIPLSSEKPDPAVLSLAKMNVDILIDNQHATVRVMQIFDNHTERTLEGKYLFALQPQSSISDFAVWDNETRIPGVMMEKRRANQIYGQIKQRRIDPGILQTTDGPGGDGTDSSSTGFSAKIFPINAFGTKRLEMEYTEELPVEGLTSHFMFPLKPSYGEAETVGELSVTLRVLSDIPIEPLARGDRAFPLQVTRSEPNEFAAEYHAQNLQLTSDLSFDYKIGVDGDALSVVTHRAPERPSAYDLRGPRLSEANPDGFFEARAVFAAETKSEPPPRRVVLLLDTSLSMYGDKLTRAVESADFFLHNLNRNDQFNLVLFNDEAVPFSPQPVAATQDNVEQAMQFIRNSSIGGGTNIKSALERAVEQSSKFADGQPSIVLISDANPTLGTSKIASIANVLDKHNARVFAFGIGNDAGQTLMKELSERTHGYFDSASETEDIALKLKLFFDKVGASDISGFNLRSTDSANLYDVYPSAGNSYPGSSLSFVGRYKKVETETLTLNSTKGNQNLSLSKQVELPDLEAAHEYLPRVWAKARIDALLAAMNRDGEREDYIDEIIRLSEKYKIVTPYTAFLAAPRSLLRPRLIEPGDPVIRVKTDPSVTNVAAVLPFGETLPLKYLQSDGVWEGRFLAPAWMVDGTYKCRLLLTDKDGNGYQEQKSFVIDSRAPNVKIDLDKTTYSAGEKVLLRASSDSDTCRLIARIYGAKPAELRWSPQDKTNVGELQIPPDLASGKYTLTVSAEDFAHNQASGEVQIEVIGK